MSRLNRKEEEYSKQFSLGDVAYYGAKAIYKNKYLFLMVENYTKQIKRTEKTIAELEQYLTDLLDDCNEKGKDIPYDDIGYFTKRIAELHTDLQYLSKRRDAVHLEYSNYMNTHKQ